MVVSFWGQQKEEMVVNEKMVLSEVVMAAEEW